MEEISNDVALLFQQFGEQFATADPLTGDGAQGDWPEPGEYDLVVLNNITVKHANVDLYGEDNKKLGRKTPAAIVQFHWERLKDPKEPLFDPKRPIQKWAGAAFRLFPDLTLLPTDKDRNKAIRDMGRFRAHMMGCLNLTEEECKNPLAKLKQLMTRLENKDVKLAVALKVTKFTPDPKVDPQTGRVKTARDFYTEYVLRLQSA